MVPRRSGGHQRAGGPFHAIHERPQSAESGLPDECGFEFTAPGLLRAVDSEKLARRIELISWRAASIPAQPVSSRSGIGTVMTISTPGIRRRGHIDKLCSHAVAGENARLPRRDRTDLPRQTRPHSIKSRRARHVCRRAPAIVLDALRARQPAPSRRPRIDIARRGSRLWRT